MTSSAAATACVREYSGSVCSLPAGGAIGLDYSCIRDVAGFLGIKKKQLAEIFPDLQVLEGEALRVMAEERENSP